MSAARRRAEAAFDEHVKATNLEKRAQLVEGVFRIFVAETGFAISAISAEPRVG
jgi:hypothetical protein